MSLKTVIIGIIFQLMLGSFMLIFSIFAGAGIANGKNPSELQTSILTFAIYALPLICFACAGIVFYFYKAGSSPLSYWWHAPSLIACILYVAFISKI